MIYAYCLSIFSIHFFAKHNISKFKLRLINQQTGDCTDSIVLNASKLTSDTFPVPIKLKGGERLLMKVKLLAESTNSSEKVMGQGVVNFDKTLIDNSLRVPIYDKEGGIEEVAICSVDFFLSGFEMQKHQSINHDKSRSMFEDWRERTEDAVYSQMSYTVESEEGEFNPNSTPIKEEIPQEKRKQTKGKDGDKQRQGEGKSVSNEKNRFIKKTTRKGEEKKQIYERTDDKMVDAKYSQISEEIENEGLGKEGDEYQMNMNPFVLQNNVYLSEESRKIGLGHPATSQQLIKTKKNSIKYSQPIKNRNILSSKVEEINQTMSPKKNQEKIIQGEALSKHKQYQANAKEGQVRQKEGDQRLRTKRRRRKIKVQEFTAYNYQNHYVTYHQKIKSKPVKVMRNIKAIKIIQNQIKQPSDEIIIPQLLHQFTISTISHQEIVTFDAIGFRAYCITNQQKQSPSIMLASQHSALKVVVELQEGMFEGMIGLQQGQQMNIKLSKISGNEEESILECSEYKLIFDIKSEYNERKSIKILEVANNDVSYRESYDILTSQNDLKKRVEILGYQPWGFAKSYTDQLNSSPESKKIVDKIKKQLPVIQQKRQKRQTMLEKESKRKKIFLNSQLQSDQSGSISRDYLQNSPIRKKLKPIPSPNSESNQFKEINSIRNGNRNNYRFKDGSTSKQIKQAWEEILFKRKLKQQRRASNQASQQRIQNTRKSKNILNALNNFNITQSDSESFTGNASQVERQVQHKLYQESDKEQKKSLFPLRCLNLKLSNFAITEPEAAIESQQERGKFVKFAIKDKAMYFTEVIFNGEYNSILWKLEGCLFNQLHGNQRLQIEVYTTVNNRITILGRSQIRVNKLYFLRANHIYNGRIAYNQILHGEFTVGFEIYQLFPFEVIQEEEEEAAKLHHSNDRRPKLGKQLTTLRNHSQKQMKDRKGYGEYGGKGEYGSKGEQRKTRNRGGNEFIEYNKIQESMSMPMGLNRQ